MDRNTPDFRALSALIRFIGSISRVREIRVNEIRVRQTRVRARARLRVFNLKSLGGG